MKRLFNGLKNSAKNDIINQYLKILILAITEPVLPVSLRGFTYLLELEVLLMMVMVMTITPELSSMREEW